MKALNEREMRLVAGGYTEGEDGTTCTGRPSGTTKTENTGFGGLTGTTVLAQ